MKPNELPLYQAPKEVEKLVIPTEESVLENGVSRVRTYVEGPISYVCNVTKQKYDASIQILKPSLEFIPQETDFYVKSAIIGASATGGWVFNSLLFPKSGRLRRFTVPLFFGGVVAVFCFPEATANIAYSTWNKAVLQSKSFSTILGDKTKGSSEKTNDNNSNQQR